MTDPLPNSIAAMAPQLAAWRRDFHAHPELAYAEHRTAARVAALLAEAGCDAVATGIGGTGVVGTVHGELGPGPAILLRADMDALPIAEATGAPHASRVAGVMHACGHDGHMAMLLGAAHRLAATRAFAGTVHLCFQPAEEDGAGAAAMLRDGLLERFPVRAAYALHNWPGLPVGRMAVTEGAVFARAQAFEIRLSGRGGHAAEPHLARDPLLAGAALVCDLQRVVSRRLDPRMAAAVSVTAFRCGDAHNVIPDGGVLRGTVRCFSDAAAAGIFRQIRAIAAGVAAAHGVGIAVEEDPSVDPATVNDPEEARFAHGVMVEVLGPDAAAFGHPPSLAGEDFGYLAAAVPTAFALLGNGDGPALHHPAYDFEDAAAPYGVAYWVRLVERALAPRGG